MNIRDFTYIKADLPYDDLASRIEHFYVLNNKAHTLEHVKAVAKTNAEIAKQYHLDVNKCTITGILHDVSVVMHPDDMTIYAGACGIRLDESEVKYPFLLHQ